MSVVGVLVAVFALGFVATVIASMFVDGRFQMSHVGTMFSSPRSSAQVVAAGPSDGDIKGAAERAVEARYAMSAGYQQKTILESVRVLDSRPNRGSNSWAVRMAMTVKTVSSEPQPKDAKHPARLSGATGAGGDPRWVNLAWSGERWFISNYEFN
ncbi:MAG TPA: hypothetical protein VK558_07250 [Patescibacteria group bacterium]|nr:hypothetical protein [Patescibacteria group bacterium]